VIAEGEDWVGAADELAALQQSVAEPLREKVSLLHHAARARGPFQLEVVRKLTEGLRKLDQRLADGEPFEQVDGSVRAGEVTFEQPNWTAETINNIGQQFIKFYVQTPTGEPAEPPTVRIPVVTLAMTRAEAADLLSGQAFDGYPAELQADFETMQAVLDAAPAAASWQSRYGDRAVDWLPFGDAGPSIADLVESNVADANNYNRWSPPLRAQFVDLHKVIVDRGELQQLRGTGCLLVVDMVSLRHPLLQQAFQLSLLDAYPHTSIVAVAPLPLALETARELRVAMQIRLADLEFARRRADKFEVACAETAERNEFERWLVGQLGRMAPNLGAAGGIWAHARPQTLASG
jgi:hypothetical protein